ncbi:hypothetical protein ACIBJE_02125 [Micromonospora sp. NPDC050187]|uniref:hypothetical protein n=1 Tax=Micromonospora sp. NPDC050187 TaxID=3364277 RepID=UPI0037BA55DD
MPSGGHANSGPPPDPGALRRDRATDPGWRVLPVTGRVGPAPEWPLTEATDRELLLWARVWAKPQAVMWEQLGQVEEVAFYVRRFVVAERPDASSDAVKVLRQMGDALGLTIPGLARNRWQIGGESHQPPHAPPATGTEGQPATPRRALAAGRERGRLKIVKPDGE